jgi:diguanylate cyclase (GGDEF)-like protein/PAS domain S-box-containing protein
MQPFPETGLSKEGERIQALLRYAVLDTPPEAVFDELTEMAARLFDMPVALVSLVDADRQWFKSRVNLRVSQAPREVAFCHHAIAEDGVMVVPDASVDPRFRENPMVTGGPGVRFYAGAPLITPSGHAVGTICVIDHRPREFTPAQAAALAVMSRQVVAQLELRLRNIELQRERTRLDLVLKGATDGWWDFNLQTGERYFAPAGWAILGYVDQELSADASFWKQLVHADDLPHLWRVLRDTLRRRHDHFSVELRLRHKAGQPVPVLARGHVMRGRPGRALRLSGTLTDLRQMRRADLQALVEQDNYEALFANSLDGVLLTHPDGSVLAANAAACEMLGHTEAELRRCGRHGLMDPRDPRLARMLAERTATGRTRGEVRMLRANGETFEVDMSSSIYTDREGKVLASAVFRDNTERHSWAQKLEESLALLHNLAQRVPGVIYQYRRFPDGRSCFPFASEGLWTIYELTADQVREDSSPVVGRLHPDDVQDVADAIATSAATLQPWHQEYRVVLPVQGERWRMGEAQPERLADGSVLWHGFITDITDRKTAEARTHQLAYFDALTGLPNRRMLIERIHGALGASQRSAQFGALLFVDLDNFKQINDARGHSVGDVLLKQVAVRLSQDLRGEDLVARLGGDEFVVLAGNLGADADSAALHARVVADKVREVLESPYTIDGTAYGCTASVGITVYPKKDESIDDLLREADIAMYRAKVAGRNRIAFFETAMQAEVEERLALEQDLMQAIAADRLVVYVQPQVDTEGREVGGELLMRWFDPRRGTVPPSSFIPVAEETGLIYALGEIVIRRACEGLNRLRASGRRLALSVNVSPRQFRKDDFVDRVRAILAETGAPASGLIFEVTEGLLIENWEATLARMSELVALGVRFSIDDFGTGYSSLSYLKKMPLFELKIDRSFVRDTPNDPSDTAIVQSVLSVARHLGLRVVAEGVETQAQADFLRANNCECMQGFLFARPMPLADWLNGGTVVRSVAVAH